METSDPPKMLMRRVVLTESGISSLRKERRTSKSFKIKSELVPIVLN